MLQAIFCELINECLKDSKHRIWIIVCYANDQQFLKKNVFASSFHSEGPEPIECSPMLKIGNSLSYGYLMVNADFSCQ